MIIKICYLILVYSVFAHALEQSVRIGTGSANAIKYSINFPSVEARLGTDFSFSNISPDFGGKFRTTTSTWNIELGYPISLNMLLFTPYLGFNSGFTFVEYTPSPNDVSPRESKDKNFTFGINFGIESVYKISNIGIGASLAVSGYNYQIQRNTSWISMGGSPPGKTASRNANEIFTIGASPGIFIGYWF